MCNKVRQDISRPIYNRGPISKLKELVLLDPCIGHDAKTKESAK